MNSNALLYYAAIVSLAILDIVGGKFGVLSSDIVTPTFTGLVGLMVGLPIKLPVSTNTTQTK